METILIGTSGYSYKDWSGVFYPPDLTKSSYLNYYSRYFDFSELNFSYYSQPKASLISHLCSQVGDQFRFVIKAHQSITHQRQGTIDDDIKTFQEGISPLREQNKLSAILFQFPFSFHYTPDNRRFLAYVCEAFKDYPLAVEFRNDKWQIDSVFAELERRAIIYTIVDTPGLSGLPDNRVVTTAETAYIRFHGRNEKNWWTGDNTSRYDYFYSEKEIDEWTEVINGLIKKVKVLLVTFNNHHKGQAVKNALSLKKKLGLPVKELE